MRVVRPVVTLAALVGGILPAAAAPELTVEYSADFTIETAEMAQTGKIYAAPGKERRESFVEGMTSVFIRRDDLGKTWMLMPAQRMYMEIKAGDESQAGSAGTDPDDYEVEMTVVGPEELDGMMTTKYRVIMTASDGGKMGGFWWITEHGIPLKMDVIAIEEGEKARFKQVLTNLEIAAQPTDLFEIPPGYAGMGLGMGAAFAKGMLGIPSGEDEEDEEDEGEDGEAAPEPKKKKGFGLGSLKEAIDKVR